MIRPTTVSDHAGLIALAAASGLFEPDQTDVLNHMLQSPGEEDVWFTDELRGTPVGVAYLAPEKMTNGTWNLYWIAIAPEHQRQGRGQAMLNHVVGWLTHKGERMLLVETAGVSEFDYVRQFYATNGFEAEARIRDFYETGVDKVVFRRTLS